MATKRRKQNAKQSATPSRWWRDQRNWMVLGALVALIAFVALMFAKRVPPTADIDLAAITKAELSDPRMLDIEHQFACPCGNCGHDDLNDCVCDVPGGALEMKTAIARLLNDGATAQEIVKAVAEGFGGLKIPSKISGSEDGGVES